MNFDFLSKYYMFFIDGAKFTIILAFFTVLIGSILGLFLALLRLSNVKIFNIKILNIIATAYVEFIRGTPLMVQIFIIYYALPDLIGINLPEMTSAVMALAINSGAYVSEIIRAGIQAVDKGQMEAARSLGMPYGMSMRYVIVPQAVKNILPALGNEFVTIIKESSVVSVIGIKELMYNADTVRGNTFRAFEPLIVAALVYFVMTFSLSKLMGWFERRMKTSD